MEAIVPKGLKSKILKFCHDEETGGHFCLCKPFSKVRNIYYWAGLQKYVCNRLKIDRHVLRSNRPQRTKRSSMQLVGAGHPMTCVATNILGLLPEAENGNKYTLVISNYFIEWVEPVHCFSIAFTK